MAIEELKPCPNCGNTDFEFGFDLDVNTKTLLKGAAKVALNPVSTSLNVAKRVYKGFLHDLTGYPVLRCCRCRNLLICCVHCEDYNFLPELPDPNKLTKCMKCYKKFFPTRYDLHFSKMIDG